MCNSGTLENVMLQLLTAFCMTLCFYNVKHLLLKCAMHFFLSFFKGSLMFFIVFVTSFKK